MFEFIKELKNIGYLVPPTKIAGSTYRVLNYIQFKDEIQLSIQCGEQSYCKPRKTLNIEDYEAYEIAFIKKGKFQNARDIILDQALLKEVKKFKEVEGIYSVVPAELVEKIYKYLTTNFRYKF